MKCHGETVSHDKKECSLGVNRIEGVRFGKKSVPSRNSVGTHYIMNGLLFYVTTFYFHKEVYRGVSNYVYYTVLKSYASKW